MSLEDDQLQAELLALAGDESDDDVKSDSSPPPAEYRSPTPSSPKKRTRAPVNRARKKARRDDSDDDEDNDGGKEDSDTGSDDESFAASSRSGRDAPMELGSDSDEEADQVLYPLEGRYKDQADKARLLAMTEIDREAALAERMQKIELEQQNRHLRNLLKVRKADKAKGDALQASLTRKSLRTKSEPKKSAEATKRGKLDELRRNREERKATGRKNSFGDEDASKKLIEEGEDDNWAEDSYVKEERPITLDDVNSCRIGRTALGKYCDYPRFVETVTDIFVRVSLFDKESQKPVYRMAQIKGFNKGKPYGMLEGNRRTDQHVRIMHGKAERDFPMDMMSDSRFTESEFNRYKNQLEVDRLPLPTLSHLQAKSKALHELTTRPLTTEEIDAMIMKRNSGKVDYIANVRKRRALNDLREQAVLDGNDEEIARIDLELQDMEDQNAGPARAETQMQRMARINAENRKRNQAEIRKAEISEKRAAREAQQKAESTGGSFANPFMRVKTVAKFRHTMEDKEKKEVAVGNSPPKDSPRATDTPPADKSDGMGIISSTPVSHKGRKLGGVDDVIANIDLGIEIDL